MPLCPQAAGVAGVLLLQVQRWFHLRSSKAQASELIAVGPCFHPQTVTEQLRFLMGTAVNKTDIAPVPMELTALRLWKMGGSQPSVFT